MKSYGSFCPVAKTSEIFAERWTPLLLRELLIGARRFSDLQNGVPQISRALLAQRLRELEDSGIVARESDAEGSRHSYRLTAAGDAFRPVIEAMSAWGMKHASDRIAPEDLDPTQLVWNMRRHLDARRLPAKRLVAQFEFSGLPAAAKARRYWWMVLRKPEIDVCLKHPGFDVDVTVAARLRAMILVWMGHRGLAEAQRAGEVAITGSPRAVADLRAVLGLHDRVEPKEFDFSTRPDPFGPVPIDDAAHAAE